LKRGKVTKETLGICKKTNVRLERYMGKCTNSRNKRKETMKLNQKPSLGPGMN
jgi:hypothetical protein